MVEPNTEATTTHTLAVKRNPRVGDELYTNHNRSRVRDPEGVPFSGFLIQWFRYDPVTDTETEIDGATNEPYFVRHTDADLQLSFTVSFTDNEGNPEVYSFPNAPTQSCRTTFCSATSTGTTRWTRP